MKTSFVFWQRWLVYSSLFLAIAAILFAFDISSAIFVHYDQAIAQIFWQTPNIPTDVQAFRKFVAGPLGGTIACAYILLAYLAWYPFGRKEQWARNAIMVSFGIWFMADSYICLKYGVNFQVFLINGLSVLQKALPIIFTWKAFKS